MPFSLSQDQQNTLTFLTGIGPGPSPTSHPSLSPVGPGVLAEESGHTWKDGTIPAEYTGTGSAQKWGGGAAGTPGGTVTYNFDTESYWNTAEQAVWKAAFSLWSAVANITFTQVAGGVTPQLLLYRDYNPDTRRYDSTASYTVNQFTPGAPGDTTVPAVTSSMITIYTSNARPTSAATPATDTIDDPDGNGIVSSFTLANGHGPSTVVHEIGHALGLFHAGPYDGSVDPTTQQYNATDTRMWTTMSYIEPGQTDSKYFADYPVTGTDWGGSASERPTQKGFMMLDVLAVQRIYGAPAKTPLSDVTFGFNTTITAPLRPFYDFTVDTDYIGTLYATGTKNSLDMSGWSTPSTINLTPGSFSSANGLVNNIAIAFGTIISKVIGGSGADAITAASFAVTLNGMQGDDSLTGGSGNDRLDGGEGSDTLTGGAGDDLLTGGAGIDHFIIDAGQDRLADLGRGGADVVQVLAGATAAATLAADWVASAASSNAGAAAIRTAGFDVDLTAATGGQGWSLTNLGNATGVALTGSGFADKIVGGSGADTLTGGGGDDVLTGGAGIDQFVIDAGQDRIVDLGLGGADVLIVSAGASANALLAGDWITTAASANAGAAVIRVAGFDADLTAASGSLGWTLTNAGQAAGVALTGSGFGDRITGGSGADTLSGGAGNDLIQGGGGADSLTGGTGNDVFRFIAGEANGDVITDFAGNGAAAGDRLAFAGYGTAAQGASFTQIGATSWEVRSFDGAIIDVITLLGSPVLVASDWSFT